MKRRPQVMHGGNLDIDVSIKDANGNEVYALSQTSDGYFEGLPHIVEGMPHMQVSIDYMNIGCGCRAANVVVTVMAIAVLASRTTINSSIHQESYTKISINPKIQSCYDDHDDCSSFLIFFIL